MKIWKSAAVFLYLFFLNQVSSETTNQISTNNGTFNQPNITITKSDNSKLNIIKDTIGNNKQPFNNTSVNNDIPKKNVISDNNVTTPNSEQTSQSNKTQTEVTQTIESNTSSNKNATKSFFNSSNPDIFVYTMESTNKTNIDTEVSDLLNVSKPIEDDLAPVEPQVKYKAEDAIDPKILMFDDSVNAVNLEGPKKLQPSTSSQLESVGLVPGKLAAILAGTFMLVSIIGYVSLLSWRRYLENRYGNREMLVNDDYCEKMNDLEHFSI